MRRARPPRSSAAVCMLAVLAACGGGGGGATPPLAGSSAAPPTLAPASTTASGTVLDDVSGQPLSGVPIALASWAPAAAAYTVVATTAPNGSFSFAAPNGQYLLRAGTDAAYTPPPSWTPPPAQTGPTPPPDAGIVSVSWQASVHDNVTLKGGAQTLIAPTLPSQPSVTPNPVETSGAYRLATLSPVEAECVATMNQLRLQNALQPLVPDEWLLENVRAYNKSQIANNTQIPTGSYILSPRNGQGAGSSTCYQQVTGEATIGNPPIEIDPLLVWFSGAWASYPNPNGSQYSPQTIAVEEWMRDPRGESGADQLWGNSAWP